MAPSWWWFGEFKSENKFAKKLASKLVNKNK